MAKEYLDQLSPFIEKATSDHFDGVRLECKHFFSGAAVYADERICISLSPVGLALKLPEKTRDRLLKSKTAARLRYFPKAPIKKDYVLFPKGIEKGGRALHKYVRESIEYALTLPKPKRKKKGPKGVY